MHNQLTDNIAYASNLNNPNQSYAYASSATPRYSDRPRPSSARDPLDTELFESSLYSTRATPQIRNQQFVNSPFDGRSVSLDRGPNYQNSNRGYNSVSTQRYGRSVYPSAYFSGQNSSYQPSISLLSTSQGCGNRRSQSYDMNLERQGLYEYNTIASSGVSTNPPMYSMYGNTESGRIDGVGTAVSLVNPVPSFGNPGGVAGYGGYGGVESTLGTLTLSNTADVVNIQRECMRLHHELDITREKLNACMTSIRTFWSPELKRERAMRKEENAKYAILADHLHQLQLEKQVRSCE